MQVPHTNPKLTVRLANTRLLSADRRLAVRAAHFYERLRRMPRNWRRRFGRRAGLTLAAAALLLALSRAPAVVPVRADEQATINVVNGEVAETDNNKCSLIEAINNANDTADGTAPGPANDDCAAGNPNGADIIALPSGGLFTVNEAVDYSYGYSATPVINSTITIQGAGSTITRSGSEHARFFTVVTEGNNEGDLTVNDLTLTNGYNIYYSGGAIYAAGATLTITNSTISGNEAGIGGGGAAYDTDLTISDSTVEDNQSYAGGGVYSFGGSLTMSDTTVSGNSVPNGFGGGVYSIYDTAEMSGLTVSGNKAIIGAGIIFADTSATLSDSLISGNEVIAPPPPYDPNDYSFYGYGGGLYFYDDSVVTVSNVEVTGNKAVQGAGVAAQAGSVVTITGSTISGNVAANTGSEDKNAGGGVFVGEATVLIETSAITGNSTTNRGGGVYAKQGNVTLSRVTLSSNSAEFGGGLAAVASTEGSVTVANSTLSGNIATVSGGGVYNSGTMSFFNTTLSANTAQTGGGLFIKSGVAMLQRSLMAGNAAQLGREGHLTGGKAIVQNHNLFGFSSSPGLVGFGPGGSDIVPAQALTGVIGPLSANGSPTQTHALAAGSPAVDASPSFDCALGPVSGVDQRGQARNRDGNGAPGSAKECDIGAFEAGTGGTPPPPPDLGFDLSLPVIVE